MMQDDRSQVKFIRDLGVADIEHDSGGRFMDHLLAVMGVLENWGESQAVCFAGLYHSIYGSELFQDFSLSLDRRAEVKELIGEHAEYIVYCFCTMDLQSLDAALLQEPGRRFLMQRQEHGSHKLQMTEDQFLDLLRVQMADWLEQVERWASIPDHRLGWQPGDAWGHRRTGYKRTAELLGGRYLKAYEEVFAREPEHTRHIVQDVTPEVKHDRSIAVKVA